MSIMTATEQAFFDDQLAEFDFSSSPYSPEQERAENSFVMQYKGCEIYWVIPNGGITVALIIVDEKVYQFSVGDKEARFYFGYNDDKGILQHCKNAIDRIR